ncbi:hypothetical protein ACF08N_01410 [Streptomyces sp. NPDC015127]
MEYGTSGVHHIQVLDFEVEVAPDYAYITLTDVTADEAAVFCQVAP